ncbi:transcriptional regulator [Sporosarcina sp. P13]|uniref:sigma-54 interaction domain-containing protein n=1 Tax=Sporosarcina sp. P13 TaxID=2048263 RepID=UPI000C16F75D|nr:sigma 54-interacting transcriptional regulator [Sporosarcina sp. P13]PIC63130.1 transcriptional regulator [Sporosarcina sp. P13]
MDNLDEILVQALLQSYEGFILSDRKGRIFFANGAVEVISGMKLDQIVGKTPEEMQENGIILKHSERILQKNPLTIYQKLISGKEIFITSKAIRDEKGKILCYAANYRDLTLLNTLFNEHLKYSEINYLELERLRKSVTQTDGIISVSESMQKVKVLVGKVAQTDATVLVLGESGTGKEVIAKSIHNSSSRSEAPYIQINCGAIPENLMEAELFGYEKGAFTGAHVSKPGLLEIANHGTVLLDEIGEMPLHLQVKLLRAIQTNEITRVGGTAKKQLDVRYIAATNKDLKKQVVKGLFREDLYYRLNVLQIELPPLRERVEDIKHLGNFFLDKLNKKYGKKLRISEGAMKLLCLYEWPGNVRQLENMMEQLVILSEAPYIVEKNIPQEISRIVPKEIDTFEVARPLKEAVEEIEVEEIKKALYSNSSIRSAAKVLEISHSTLIRKIKQYGIQK